MNTRQEYGLDQDHGHAPKAFTLKPATDPITLVILELRRTLIADRRVTRPAKACFVEILDRALNSQCPGFICKGSVAISDSTLARIFGVTCRTIYTWKKLLAACGYVWLSQKFRTDRFPLTTYNVTALRPKQHDFAQDDDGSAQGANLRRAWVNPSVGARRPGQPGLHLPGSRQTAPATENAENRAISAENRVLLRQAAEEKIGSQPIQTSADSRSKDRQSAEEKIGSQPIQIAAVSRSEDRKPAEAIRQHNEPQNGEGEKIKRGEGNPPPQDAEFQKFKEGLKGLFDSRLEARRKELKAKLDAAEDPAERRFWRLRIEAVDEVRLGGRPPAPAKTKPKPAADDGPGLTDEEVLAHIDYALAQKKPHLIKPAHLKVAEKHGRAIQ